VLDGFCHRKGLPELKWSNVDNDWLVLSELIFLTLPFPKVDGTSRWWSPVVVAGGNGVVARYQVIE
jgi:hypothetical protein